MSTVPSARPAHLGWRLLALVYDLFPLLALLMLGSGLLLLARGGQPVAPGSLAAQLELLALWAVCGGYFVLSWRRGGQTLGMRPWRLQVLTSAGYAPTLAALWQRYAMATAPATLLLLVIGWWSPGNREWLWAPVGLWAVGGLWGLVDVQRRGWHDLASGTVMVRRED
jgi:uncharacterized RDD family membrane protein YckC